MCCIRERECEITLWRGLINNLVNISVIDFVQILIFENYGIKAFRKYICCYLQFLFVFELGVISKVRTSRINERNFLRHFTPSLPPQTKVWSTMGLMYGRWLCPLSSFFPTSCPNSVVCLTQGCFPGGSASIAKWTWRQSCTVEERYNFYFFFSVFLHAQKRTAGVDLQCWTGASVCHCLFSAFNWRGLQKPIDICDGLISAACMHIQPFLLGLVWDRAMTCDTLIYWRLALNASNAARSFALLFPFFLLLSIAQRIGSKPPPSHMKVLSFVRDVRTFEMTPYEGF